MSEALPFKERLASLDISTGYVGNGAVAGRLGGVDAGDVGFDPLGFSNHELGPFDTPEEHMAWIREAEIKHGRICMLATVGWLGVDAGMTGFGVPSELKGLNSYLAHDVAVADGRLIVLLIACGVFEIAGAGGIKASLEGTRVPGDFQLTGGFGKTPESLAKLRENEILHCRLGMLAFAGVATQAGLVGPSGVGAYWPA